MDVFEHAGFAILRNAVSPDVISELIHGVQGAIQTVSPRQRRSDTYAIRNLLEAVPAVTALVESNALRSFLEPILGPGAFAVRGLLFDKTPEANWKVPWHQDLTIAVKRRAEVAGFGPWSVKAGVQHVQPPVSVLERMLTLRLHLDDCGENNGPLHVLPGSHLAGRLSAEDIQAWRDRTSAVACTVNRGGLLLMRPLLLHASFAAREPGHRRIIHLEFAEQTLPDPLEWTHAPGSRL